MSQDLSVAESWRLEEIEARDRERSEQEEQARARAQEEYDSRPKISGVQLNVFGTQDRGRPWDQRDLEDL